jgi:hypothetical protein
MAKRIGLWLLLALVFAAGCTHGGGLPVRY